MIIVRLVGGLGNQLFQYATGRAIAHRNDIPLRLDISKFRHYPDRDYRLKHFNINASTISAQAVASITRQDDIGSLKRFLFLIRNGLPLHRHFLLKQRTHHFDPEILESTDNVCLVGYWQSEKYFKHIRDILLKELKVRHEPDPTNRAMADRIARTESVSLHVRRGDYISNPKTYQHHGVCSLAYYDAAMDRLTEVIKDPHVFVFSDDVGWAQENLRLDCPVIYVSHNDVDKDYEDLRLMSQCQHHIIANSTFSWWGAWLCTNPDKIVIAPRRWFKNPNRDGRDIVPDRWMRI